VDADGWDRRYAAAERFFTSGPSPIVTDVVAGLDAGRALDLAAGEGRHSLWLARRGWRVTAVDFSRVGVERGRGWAQDEGLAVDWVLEDVYAYEPPAASFDLVLIAHFHPAPPERERVFRRVVDALVPGGHVLVVGRHLDDLGRDGGRGPSNPDLRYTPEELRDAFPEDLELLRCEGVPRVVEGDDGPVELTDVVAFGRRR
jgi:SAM-dependent methyltransferase